MLKINDRVVTQTSDGYNEKFGVIKEVGDSHNFRVLLDDTEEDSSFFYVLFGAEELLKVRS